MSRIDEVLLRVQGPDVLDIGCSGQADRRSPTGSAWWLHGRLLEEHPDAVGLEYSAPNVATLTAEGVPNVVQGDAQDFAFDRTFDTIVAGEIIEHLERPGDFLTCAARHLKPGGRIVLTTPYAFHVGYVIYAWLKYPKTVSNPEHTMWLCPETMHILAHRSGLRVQEWRLVDSIRSDLPSRTSRISSRLFRLLGPLLPQRLRANTMVFVLSV
jgi:2-polyprenyl-3-methyl-5-hydroxy-6-metoxy-1,4-benzoquinol methylase